MKKVIAKKPAKLDIKKTFSQPTKSKIVFFAPFLFFSLILFLMVFILFIVNLTSVCLSFGSRHLSLAQTTPSLLVASEESVTPELISAVPVVLSEPASVEEIKEIKENSWQETELLTLPDSVISLLNVSYASSPDGSRFAYIINSDNQAAINLDGQTGPLYDKITFMSFSPDSRHFAYGVKLGANEAVVVDGQLQALYDFIFPPYFFTPDSQHFVYRARNSAGDFMVIDNQPGRAYEQTYSQFMSADGQSLIYYARIGKTIYKNTLKLGE
jgi:hypothetical protein